MRCDVFISHASEDQDAVATPLARALQGRGLSVWLDRQQLQPGDSLRRAIEDGLRGSRLAVVVLSPAYLRKDWTQRELDALLALEQRSDGPRILPVWHQLDAAAVALGAPVLAGRLGVSTDRGLAMVADWVASAAGPAAPGAGDEAGRLLSRLIADPSEHNLRRLRYEADALVARRPDQVEALMLRDQVHAAWEQGHPPSPAARPAASAPLSARRAPWLASAALALLVLVVGVPMWWLARPPADGLAAGAPAVAADWLAERDRRAAEPRPDGLGRLLQRGTGSEVPAPDGVGAVVVYDSRFEHGMARERVLLRRVDGRWRVEGYEVLPVPGAAASGPR